MSESNIKPSTLFTGDNLRILQGFNSESVDLIYLDPPFNSNRHYKAPIGSKAAGAGFKDAWTLDDVDRAWVDMIEEDNPALAAIIKAVGAVRGNGSQSYLSYLAIRLIELKRVLKDTGSIYLHCDPTESHSLKLLMDGLFGVANFRNEVVWCYHAGGASKKAFSKKHDTLLLYGKDASRSVHNILRMPYRDLYAYQENHDNAKGIYHPDGKMLHDWWEISLISSKAKERTGYPTQKPLALLERIVKASSNKGDVVLDPFCGCATACLAAAREHRKWIGIDISAMAVKLIKSRMRDEIDLVSTTVISRDDIPHRTDLGKLVRYNAPENKRILYGNQEGYCNGCKHHFEYRNFAVDNVIPQAKGGSDHFDNLQLLCGACNSSKGHRFASGVAG